MTKAIRVKMEATYLLRTSRSDWRDAADIDTAIRVLGALFEDCDIAFEGEEVGPCTCEAGEPWDGDFGVKDVACPWHGRGQA